MAINFPTTPSVNQVYTYGSRTWTWTGYGWQATSTTLGPQGLQGNQGVQGPGGNSIDIGILDNLRNLFNGRDVVFTPTYQGKKVSITNPETLELYLNGIKQKVLLTTPTWISTVVLEPASISINNDGNISFSSPPAPGSMFEGRVIAGSATTGNTTNYPFAPMELMMGAL